jgi:hypothetical protein
LIDDDDDVECGVVGKINGRGNGSFWRKPALVAVSPPEIPYDLPQART